MIREVNYATFAVDHRDSLRIVSFNRGFTNLTGYTETDIYAGKMTLCDIIPANIWEEYVIAVNRSSRSENGAGYLEHPILRKDGSSIVVLCYGKIRDDGSDISDILITDITAHIEAQNTVIQQAKENRLLLKKLSFISEHEEEYILDYNCRSDHFSIANIKNGENQIIYSVDNYTSSIHRIKTIHPDDLQDYANVFLNAPSLQKRASFDFRSNLFDGQYSWYRATYAPYHDEQTDETHIIGRIINIDHEVMKSQEFKKQSQLDSLTSLYNQGASRSKIDDIALETPEKSLNAFVIMNLNNFKEVNDTYGHAQGDEILRDVSETLRHFFKFGSDIIGRLGGDEFVIFMRDVPSAALVKKYCDELLDEIRQPHFHGQTKFHVTASMGIAMQDNGPDSFDHLYKCADEALYIQKHSGKSGICFYQA